MAFSKSFPRTIKGSSYPIWEEVFLSETEEEEQEKECRKENIHLMQECISDAKGIIELKNIDPKEVIAVAQSLFDKRASHVVYWKENKAKEKFDSIS